MYTAADAITAALAGVLIILLGVIGVRAWRRSRISPEEKERRRRGVLAARGKMGDARLLELQEGLLIYSYDVRGVTYTATQDISRLKTYLPSDASSLGHVVVKYDPHNPANSILLAEDWSGFQFASPAASPPVPPLPAGQ